MMQEQKGDSKNRSRSARLNNSIKSRSASGLEEFLETADFQNLINTIPEMIILYDNNQEIIWLNAAAIAKSELLPEQIVGKQCSNIFKECDTICDDCPVEKCFKTGKVEEKKIHIPGGSIYLIKAIPIVGIREDVKFVLESARDITEEFNIKNDLVENKETLSAMFEYHGSIMYMVDPETFQILDANKAAEDFYGYTKYELKQMKTFDLNMMSEEEVRSEIKKAESENRESYFLQHKIANGEIKDVELCSTPIIIHNSRKVYFVIVYDISNRTRLQKQLIDNQRFLEDVLDSIQSGIVVLDKKLKVLRVNSYAKKLFKIDNNPLGRICYEALLNNDHICDNCPSIKSLNTRQANTLEANFPNSDYPEKCLEMTSYPVFDSKGDLTGVIEYIKDITSVKQIEAINNSLFEISNAVLRSKNLNELLPKIHDILSKVLDTTNFFIALYDEKTDIIRFPYFIDQMDEKFEIISASKSGSFTSKVIQTGKPFIIKKHEIIEILKSRGATQWGTIPEVWLGVPLMDKNNVIGAVAVQNYDNPEIYNKNHIALLESVSNQIAIAIERKKYEQEIVELNADLERRVSIRTTQLEESNKKLQELLRNEKELNQLKSNFISMVSHEYRTPLTVILTSSYIIEKLFDNADKNNFLKQVGKIQYSVSAMTKLLEDVLMYGKTVSDGFKANNYPFDIISATRSIIYEIEILDKKKHKIELNHNDPKVVVNTDHNLYQQILSSILINATKFSDEGTKVIVSINQYANDMIIKIRDFGIGIRPEDSKLLFEPFHKGQGAAMISGSGLGLSIAKKAAEALDAKIEFDSVPGEGTEFKLIIPLIDNPE